MDRDIREVAFTVVEVAEYLGVSEMSVRRHDNYFKPRRLGFDGKGLRYYPAMEFLEKLLKRVNNFPNAQQQVVAAAIRILTSAKGEEYVKALQREAEHVKGWEDME